MHLRINRLSGAVAMAVCMTVAMLQSSAVAQINEVCFERVSNGFQRPVFACSAPGDPDRLYVVEQHTGDIEILDLSSGSITHRFLDLPTTISTGNEQGLLGLAFHPDYVTNGKFYVYYTNNVGDTRVEEYTRLNPNAANPSSANLIMTFDQPFSNHNGGWLGFGPDGYLYISSGDGGSANDPLNNSQDITNNLLGKMLRVDIDSDDFPSNANKDYAIPPSNPFVGVTGDDEIYCYGLRNPWRCSFDRLTGDLWMGDVGQNAREEIDVKFAGDPGGQNYGWRIREGTLGSNVPGAIDPPFQYVYGSANGFSITGGYVYRGPVAGIDGHFVFGDYVTDRIWSFRLNETDETQFDGTNFTDLVQWTSLIKTDIGTIRNISSFAEDGAGNLYVLDLAGEIFKLTEISPVTIVAGVESANVVSGIIAGGSIADLADSDNTDFQVQKNPQQIINRIEMELAGTSHTDDPTLLEITLEGSVFSRPDIQQEIELFNYRTSQWAPIDTRQASRFGDQTTVVAAQGDLSRFIEPGTMEVKARIRFVAPTPRASFSANTDQFFWTITN
ncbi:MAG: PQQ-dependent sugar dehydrogenase [Planctomycetota bacterium]